MSWYPVAAEAEGKRAGLAPTEGGNARTRVATTAMLVDNVINDYLTPRIAYGDAKPEAAEVTSCCRHTFAH
jgi:hypothetical protein